MPEEVWVHALYCDDCRAEAGGKFSYFGVYNSDLIVQSFPAVLTRLCIKVDVKIPIGEASEQMNVAILDGDRQVAEFNWDKATNLGNAPDAPASRFNVLFTLSAFRFSEPTSVKVQVTHQDRVFAGNTLRVRAPTTDELAQRTHTSSHA